MAPTSKAFARDVGRSISVERERPSHSTPKARGSSSRQDLSRTSSRPPSRGKRKRHRESLSPRPEESVQSRSRRRGSRRPSSKRRRYEKSESPTASDASDTSSSIIQRGSRGSDDSEGSRDSDASSYADDLRRRRKRRRVESSNGRKSARHAEGYLHYEPLASFIMPDGSAYQRVLDDDMTLANAQAFASAKLKAPVRLSYISRIGHARTKLRIEVDDEHGFHALRHAARAEGHIVVDVAVALGTTSRRGDALDTNVGKAALTSPVIRAAAGSQIDGKRGYRVPRGVSAAISLDTLGSGQHREASTLQHPASALQNGGDVALSGASPAPSGAPQVLNGALDGVRPPTQAAQQPAAPAVPTATATSDCQATTAASHLGQGDEISSDSETTSSEDLSDSSSESSSAEDALDAVEASQQVIIAPPRPPVPTPSAAPPPGLLTSGTANAQAGPSQPGQSSAPRRSVGRPRKAPAVQQPGRPAPSSVQQAPPAASRRGPHSSPPLARPPDVPQYRPFNHQPSMPPSSQSINNPSPPPNPYLASGPNLRPPVRPPAPAPAPIALKGRPPQPDRQTPSQQENVQHSTASTAEPNGVTVQGKRLALGTPDAASGSAAAVADAVAEKSAGKAPKARKARKKQTAQETASTAESNPQPPNRESDLLDTAEPLANEQAETEVASMASEILRAQATATAAAAKSTDTVPKGQTSKAKADRPKENTDAEPRSQKEVTMSASPSEGEASEATVQKRQRRASAKAQALMEQGTVLAGLDSETFFGQSEEEARISRELASDEQHQTGRGQRAKGNTKGSRQRQQSSEADNPALHDPATAASKEPEAVTAQDKEAANASASSEGVDEPQSPVTPVDSRPRGSSGRRPNPDGPGVLKIDGEHRCALCEHSKPHEPASCPTVQGGEAKVLDRLEALKPQLRRSGAQMARTYLCRWLDEHGFSVPSKHKPAKWKSTAAVGSGAGNETASGVQEEQAPAGDLHPSTDAVSAPLLDRSADEDALDDALSDHARGARVQKRKRGRASGPAPTSETDAQVTQHSAVQRSVDEGAAVTAQKTTGNPSAASDMAVAPADDATPAGHAESSGNPFPSAENASDLSAAQSAPDTAGRQQSSSAPASHAGHAEQPSDGSTRFHSASAKKQPTSAQRPLDAVARARQEVARLKEEKQRLLQQPSDPAARKLHEAALRRAEAAVKKANARKNKAASAQKAADLTDDQTGSHGTSEQAQAQETTPLPETAAVKPAVVDTTLPVTPNGGVSSASTSSATSAPPATQQSERSDFDQLASQQTDARPTQVGLNAAPSSEASAPNDGGFTSENVFQNASQVSPSKNKYGRKRPGPVSRASQPVEGERSSSDEAETSAVLTSAKASGADSSHSHDIAALTREKPSTPLQERTSPQPPRTPISNQRSDAGLFLQTQQSQLTQDEQPQASRKDSSAAGDSDTSDDSEPNDDVDSDSIASDSDSDEARVKLQVGAQSQDDPIQSSLHSDATSNRETDEVEPADTQQANDAGGQSASESSDQDDETESSSSSSSSSDSDSDDSDSSSSSRLNRSTSINGGVAQHVSATQPLPAKEKPANPFSRAFNAASQPSSQPSPYRPNAPQRLSELTPAALRNSFSRSQPNTPVSASAAAREVALKNATNSNSKSALEYAESSGTDSEPGEEDQQAEQLSSSSDSSDSSDSSGDESDSEGKHPASATNTSSIPASKLAGSAPTSAKKKKSRRSIFDMSQR